MSPSALRIAIPLLVAGIALTVVIVTIVAKPAAPPPQPQTPPTDPTAVAADGSSEVDDAGDAPGEAARDAAGDAAVDAAVDGETPASEPPADDVTAAADVELKDLTAVAPGTGITGHDRPPAALGSLDPALAAAKLEFSRAGAGIERITCSDIWESAAARIQADRHAAAVADGKTPGKPMPDDALRYVLQESRRLSNQLRGAGFMVPSLAAHSIEINGQRVLLFDYNTGADGEKVYIWAETAPGEFETNIVNADGEPVLRITRRFVLGDDFDVTIDQTLENLSGAALTVKWMQYGPSGLRLDRSRYMDRRRYRFGFEDAARAPPNVRIVYADDNDLLIERNDILKRWEKSEEARLEGDSVAQREHVSLWPNKTSRKKAYGLSWFGSTNRYFTITVHPPLDAAEQGELSLGPVVDKILLEVSYPDPASTERDDQVIFTYLQSPSHVIEPGAELALDLGVYAGPLDRHVLDTDEAPYRKLSMDKLILYQMSSFCAICTFQWLAYLLIDFLTVLHNWVVFDWGVAIMLLVVVVRVLLHPITKRSQISMQRFGKQMQAMKPELDKLQKKFGHDPKKMQQEQMRLMREHGANPLQMLGCLPMFLQTPIWIALYAMLYFAFDLRQEAAFFGIFQKLTGGAWPFLADLSSADHFFGQLQEPTQFFLWNITGFNFLPILMGIIFFIQQKYMAPPPSPTMTDDQLRQQKIMKVMMVVLFPLMLYSAPSGLTLYILTSSSIGILESRYVRRHITEMDLNPPKPKKKPGRGKPKDAQGRAFAAAMDRMEEKKRAKKRGPEKKFKKRK